MRYTFKYKKTELGREAITCVDIPQIHTEQLDPSPVKIAQDAYDALNMYLSIAVLTGEQTPLPSCKYEGNGYFKAEVTPTNENKILAREAS